MKRLGHKNIWLVFVFLFVLLLSGFLVVLAPPPPIIPAGIGGTKDQEGLDALTETRILNATLQIYMISLVEGDRLRENGVRIVNSLGTLIAHEGETFIITHDHWWYIDEVKIIQFYNPAGELLLEMNEKEFLRTIRYRDTGTMVLAAPEKLFSGDRRKTSHDRIDPNQIHLPAPATFGDGEEVRVGETVFVARQSPDHPKQVSLLACRVQSIEIVEGIQVFRLKSLKGEVIIRGDSGGGIWRQGRLIANTWKTTTKINLWIWLSQPSQQSEFYLDRSTAAQIPAGFLSIFHSPHQSPPVITRPDFYSSMGISAP